MPAALLFFIPGIYSANFVLDILSHLTDDSM